MTENLLPEQIRFILSLTPSFRRILLYFYKIICARDQEGKRLKIFPSVTWAAKKCGCSLRTVQRFKKFGQGVLFDIQARKNNAGGDSSDEILFTKEALYALNWLDRRNLLYAPKNRLLSILREAENVTPPSSENVTPYNLPSSNLSPNPVSYAIYPKLRDLGIDEKAKSYLSSLPERAIMLTIEDAKNYWDRELRKGRKIDNLSALCMKIGAKNRRKCL